MKAVQLAVVLLIVCISSAEALKCNRCVPLSPGGSCSTTVETCWRNDDVCASVSCSYPMRTLYFRRCMKKADAYIMASDRNCRVHTCSIDRCN